MREIDVEGLEAVLRDGGQVVDVREPREWVAGHVAGTRLIPMGQLAARLGELDRTRPVPLICGSGNRSGANPLTAQGFDAVDVGRQPGPDPADPSRRASDMCGTHDHTHSHTHSHTHEGVAHRTTAPTATIASLTADAHVQRLTGAAEGLTLVTIETASLGDRSYLVHDGEVAAVVDPQRDVDRVLAVLEQEGVRLTHVLETHVHNDYVTGGWALAQRTGAAYLVNAADDVSYERTPVRDGEVVEVGPRMRITALATPGHTFTHLSYALSVVPAGATPSEPVSVGAFTGGSLLFGATGRPDLLGPEHTDALVHHQHASARRLADLLPDEAAVLPTHGFGSFCSATQSEATSSTIGQEKRSNPVLTQDEETYVRELLAGLDVWPAYYVHMAPSNSAGPTEPDLSAPQVADAAELRRRIEAGEWVVDLRDRTAFAAGHAPGTLNVGVDGPFSTYLGWLLPWGTSVTLLGESAEQVARAQRELVRIGIDRPAAHATGGPEDWAGSADAVASFPTGTFADLAQARHHRDVLVLDVRRTPEHAEASLPGSLNVPLHELPARVGEVAAALAGRGAGDQQVWVHCAGGYRASVAASLLDAAGLRVVAVDDSIDNAAAVGLELVNAARAADLAPAGAR